MRFHKVLSDIAGSRSKARVLETLLDLPAKAWTGRQLALHAGISQSQANAALKKFKEYGIVRSTRAGAAVVWAVNANHFLMSWLQPLASASRSLPALLAERLERAIGLEKVEKAVLFGSVARGDERPTSDVDLLVVVKNPRDKEEIRNKILALSVELLDVFGGNPLVPVVHTRNEANKRKNSVLMQKIRKEGIIVYDGEAA